MTILEIQWVYFLYYSVLRFGRRIPYCTFMLIGGVAGMLVLAVPDKAGEGAEQMPVAQNVSKRRDPSA